MECYMNINGFCSLFAACLWTVVAPAQEEVYIAKYLGDCQAAVTFTFDDGLLEHYTEVFPRLQQLGLKATFGIIGSKVGRNQKGTPCMTWHQLREMAAAGQEITSHGYQHRSMEKLTGEALRYEVQHNDTLIFNNVGVFPRTYFFPGNRKTDEGLAFTQRDRVGTRTFQVSLGSKRDSLWVQKWLKRILKRGEWAVMMTHGINEGYDAFPNPQLLWDCFQQVARMKDCLWVATLHDVLAYQVERDTVQLEVKSTKVGMTVIPHHPLDSQIFCQQLTLVVTGNVKDATQQDRKLLLVRKGDKTLMDFDLNGGPVTIRR